MSWDAQASASTLAGLLRSRVDYSQPLVVKVLQLVYGCKERNI